MTEPSTLQGYVRRFRAHLSSSLKPGIGIACTIYPATEGGAILLFTIGPEIPNEETFKPAMPRVNDALALIDQKAFGGNLAGFIFQGTNIIGEDNRVILIKGDDSPQTWSDADALQIVRQLARPKPVVRA